MNTLETKLPQKEYNYTEGFTKQALVDIALEWMAQGEISRYESTMSSALETLAIVTLDAKKTEDSIEELAILGQYNLSNHRSNHFINIRYISPHEMGNFIVHSDDLSLNQIRGQRQEHDGILSDIWKTYGPFAYADVEIIYSEAGYP